MSKETDRIESDDRERGRKELYIEKKDAERRVRGGRMMARKNKWGENNIKHDILEDDR